MTRWPVTLDYPPIWTLAFAVAIWVIGRFLPWGLPALVPLGWLVIVAALALMIWAANSFRRAGTTVNPHGEPEALVASGPFAWSRNPIYLADAMILLGLSLIWQALIGLILIPLFMAVITRRFIRPEEARLSARFPDGFARYARQVRRWI